MHIFFPPALSSPLSSQRKVQNYRWMYETVSRYFFYFRAESGLRRGKRGEQYVIRRKLPALEYRRYHRPTRNVSHMRRNHGMTDQRYRETSIGTERGESIHNSTGGRRSTKRDGGVNSGSWPEAVARQKAMPPGGYHSHRYQSESGAYHAQRPMPSNTPDGRGAPRADAHNVRPHAQW
jgi:hypothetical protein